MKLLIIITVNPLFTNTRRQFINNNFGNGEALNLAMQSVANGDFFFNPLRFIYRPY